MPFTWTESIAADTKITTSQLNEIKTKADTAASTIGITAFNWSSNLSSGVAVGRKIDTVLYTEMRQAVDYLYDNRTCTSNFTTNRNPNNSTQNSTNNTSVCGTNRVSENGTFNTGVNTSVNSSHRSPENSTVFGSNFFSARYTQNSTVNNPFNSTVNSNFRSSDERLKYFIGTISNALEKVLNLNGYYYYENELAKSLGLDNNLLQVGVSAQEVQNVLPEVVLNNGFMDNYLTVDYSRIVVLLIEAMKEQQKQIDELNKKVNQLEV